jgi:hypothetical protein
MLLPLDESRPGCAEIHKSVTTDALARRFRKLPRRAANSKGGQVAKTRAESDDGEGGAAPAALHRVREKHNRLDPHQVRKVICDSLPLIG